MDIKGLVNKKIEQMLLDKLIETVIETKVEEVKGEQNGR